jgi:hypothetical protein
MGWDKGRYYTRSVKINGRVIRQYIGGGLLGALAARMDAADRRKRRRALADQRRPKADLGELDDELRTLARLTDLAAHVALLAAGYHQHHRGEWRKRRDGRDSTG